MPTVTIRKVLDTVRQNRTTPIFAVQGDYNSRYINAVIASDGEPVRVSVTSVVTVNYVRRDNESKAFSGVANPDGTVTVPIPQWAIELEGDVTCTVSVAGVDAKLSTTQFLITVQYSPVTSVEISEDDPEYDDILVILAKLAEQNNTFSNALKGTPSGAMVSMDDVSPVTHNVGVGLRSKNLIPYPYSITTGVRSGITYTVNSDGSIILNGTTESDGLWLEFVTQTFNGSYTGYIYNCPSNVNIALWGQGSNGTLEILGAEPTAIVINEEVSFCISMGGNEAVDNVTIYPMLEFGTTATAYTPYVSDDTEVTVKSCGKNLLDINAKVYSQDCTVTTSDNSIVIQASGENLLPIKHLFEGRLSAGTYTISFDLKCVNSADTSYRPNELIPFADGVVFDVRKCTETGQQVFSCSIDKDADIFIAFYCTVATSTLTDYQATLSNIQLEKGTTATAYEPYKEGETITTTIADGAELNSISPNMTIFTDTEGVLVDVKYNRDANIVINNLENRIAALEAAITTA